MQYKILFFFYLQHGRKSKQVYWMSPAMDDMYNQLYMLPDSQHFYVTEPAFSLMLGHGDIFSVSSYSLAMMKTWNSNSATTISKIKKKRTTSENNFFLQSEVEVQIVSSEDDTKIEMVPVVSVPQPSGGETLWPELVVKYPIIALGSQVFVFVVIVVN